MISDYQGQNHNNNAHCAPGFSNPNQKVHGIFHFYIAGMYRIDQQVCPVETPRWKPPMVGFHLKKWKPPT